MSRWFSWASLNNGWNKWNESGFRPLLCTHRLNWARRTSWGRWNEWDDSALQTQGSKFKPWRSEAEHATSQSRRLPTILSFRSGWGRNMCVSFKPPRPGTEPRTVAWRAAVLTTTIGPPPQQWLKQGPYSRTSFDISWASDWSRWPSRPIRSPRYIVTCAIIRPQNLKLKVSAGHCAQWKILGLSSVRRYLTLGLDYSIGRLESVTFQLHDRILSSSVATSFKNLGYLSDLAMVRDLLSPCWKTLLFFPSKITTAIHGPHLWGCRLIHGYSWPSLACIWTAVNSVIYMVFVLKKNESRIKMSQSQF